MGRGIAPSLSPALHEREGRRLGLDYRYDRLELRAGDADVAVRAALLDARRGGMRGVNVTHPVKQLVVPHLDDLALAAEHVGAVNAVVLDGGRAVGHNTDVAGFRTGLERGLRGAERRTVVLIGAGGAGAAAAHALVAFGVERLHVLDADAARAADLVARLRRLGTGRAEVLEAGALPTALAASDGLVNATPTGMAAAPGSPVPDGLLRADLWVADLVYRPLRTALLRAAAERGSRTVDGGEMAVVQAAESFRLFTDVEPDVDRMRAHFDELVADERAGAA